MLLFMDDNALISITVDGQTFNQYTANISLYTYPAKKMLVYLQLVELNLEEANWSKRFSNLGKTLICILKS